MRLGYTIIVALVALLFTLLPVSGVKASLESGDVHLSMPSRCAQEVKLLGDPDGMSSPVWEINQDCVLGPDCRDAMTHSSCCRGAGCSPAQVGMVPGVSSLLVIAASVVVGVNDVQIPGTVSGRLEKPPKIA